MTPSPLPLPWSRLSAARACAAELGFNLCGVASVASFDAGRVPDERLVRLWPHAQSAVVLGVGGTPPGLDQRERVVPAEICAEMQLRLDRALGAVREALGLPIAQSYRLKPGRRQGCGLKALAECAGLGTVSPVIGQLMHPTFGPWVHVCAALLVAAPPPSEPASEASACMSCSGQACIDACPAGALAGGHFDARRCAEHRHTGGCRERCAARRACPVGDEFRWPEGFEAQIIARNLPFERRQFGLGWWGFLPEWLRCRSRRPVGG